MSEDHREDKEASYRSKALDRLVGLTDDVFAFAITLLVLELVTPAVTGPVTNSSVASALAQEYQPFVDFIVSFWVVALHWIAHHRIFRYIRSFDNGLLSLNLLYLFFIVIIPFATRVLDSYETTQVAILVFAVPQIGASLMNSIVWRYASNNRRLVDEHVSQRTIRWFWLRGVFSATAFALSVLLAFITPYLTLASWFTIPPVLQYLDRRYGGQKGG